MIIKSIDRLGRNYDMIINEWAEITKIIEAIKILNLTRGTFFKYAKIYKIRES